MSAICNACFEKPLSSSFTTASKVGLSCLVVCSIAGTIFGLTAALSPNTLKVWHISLSLPLSYSLAALSFGLALVATVGLIKLCKKKVKSAEAAKLGEAFNKAIIDQYRPDGHQTIQNDLVERFFCEVSKQGHGRLKYEKILFAVIAEYTQPDLLVNDNNKLYAASYTQLGLVAKKWDPEKVKKSIIIAVCLSNANRTQFGHEERTGEAAFVKAGGTIGVVSYSKPFFFSSRDECAEKLVELLTERPL